MKWHVLVRPAGRTDLQEARNWYESKRAGLGDEFLLSVADAFARLEESPERFPIYYEGFRRIITGRFPYKVFYRIEGDDVIVFRVLHATQDHPRHLR
jgi:plasmid stabilization system protein ParE